MPNPTMPNLPGTEDAELYTYLINLNHTYTLISFGRDYLYIYTQNTRIFIYII